MLFISEWYSGSDLYIYTDKNDLNNYLGKEHAFLIVNHACDVDWLFVGILSDKLGYAGVCTL